MKLQQLKYLLAIADNRLNITAAANSLYTSQPGVSKQLKLIEEELGLTLFIRKGKSLVSITEAGKSVIEHARSIFRDVDKIKNLADTLQCSDQGTLNIATTQTQARYVLPSILAEFHTFYPDVRVNLQQGTTEQISELIENGKTDFAIASGSEDYFPDLSLLPTFDWERVIIAPEDHPLAQQARDGRELTLDQLSEFPLVSYSFSFDDQSSLRQAFKARRLDPNVVFTASDPDVIKSHVRSGHGVGIIAEMAFSEELDHGLVRIPASHLFPSAQTWVGFKKHQFLANYHLKFIELLAPHWTDRAINHVHRHSAPGRVAELPDLESFDQVRRLKTGQLQHANSPLNVKPAGRLIGLHPRLAAGY